MNFALLGPGKDAPNEVNVIIEIPANGGPVKYEVDKESGTLMVDRFMSTSMLYPCNYGYIPETLAEDGDPADVLVVTPAPLISGSVIRVRPIGMLKMTDESGPDAKILAVPIDKLSVFYRKVERPQDLDSNFLDTIEHFFQRYKDLEQGKWVKTEGWVESSAAKEEIKQCIIRFKETEKVS